MLMSVSDVMFFWKFIIIPTFCKKLELDSMQTGRAIIFSGPCLPNVPLILHLVIICSTWTNPIWRSRREKSWFQRAQDVLIVWRQVARNILQSTLVRALQVRHFLQWEYTNNHFHHHTKLREFQAHYPRNQPMAIWMKYCLSIGSCIPRDFPKMLSKYFQLTTHNQKSRQIGTSCRLNFFSNEIVGLLRFE